MKKIALVVIGAHRSGTSALTRVLSMLGAALPQHLLPPDAKQNPSGFWESQKVMEFNDRVLRSAESIWDDVLAVRLGLLPMMSDPDLIQNARLLINEEFHNAPFIVLKDPRISVLTPLWLNALVSADYSPIAVISLRNPLAVAGSLAVRNGFSFRKSMLLWTSYMIAGERDTRSIPRSFIQYDKLLQEWRAVVFQLEADTGYCFDTQTPAAEEIDQFLRSDLRRQPFTDRDFFDCHGVWTGTRTTYAKMLQWPDEKKFAELAEIESGLLSISDALGDMLVGAEVEIRDLKATLSSFEEKHSTLGEGSGRASKHENKLRPLVRPAGARWWQSPAVVRNINKRICGYRLDGTDAGDIALLSRISGGSAFKRAASPSHGNGYHEIRMLEAGVVDVFDLFDVSEQQVQVIRDEAQKVGVSTRLNIHTGPEARIAANRTSFDLIYWKDALHKEPDPVQAVDWSAEMLKDEGLFFMNDFIGPHHMKYTSYQLYLARRVQEIFDGPKPINEEPPSTVSRPSGSAKSEILEAILKAFDDVAVIPTGGVVYALALRDVLDKIDEEREESLLEALMLIDELYADLGETLYAVAYARKARNTR